MPDLHVLAQRVPDPEYLAGLERQEVLLMLSNSETKNLLEAMLAEILGRPLCRGRDRPDIAGGMLLNMLLASLTGLTLYAPDVFPDWLRERAAIFTAEFMRIVKAVSCPGETIAEHIGEFNEIYVETRDALNPWVQTVTLDLIQRLDELDELTPDNELIVYQLIMMRKCHITPVLAAKLAPFTARALQRTETLLAAETDDAELIRLAAKARLYHDRLAFYICMSVDEP